MSKQKKDSTNLKISQLRVHTKKIKEKGKKLMNLRDLWDTSKHTNIRMEDQERKGEKSI